jgi:hypothetical protein
MSTKHKDNNHLFMPPWDFASTPGCRDVVKTAMDLKTLSRNVEAGEHSCPTEFFVDAKLCLMNAMAHHKDADNTRCIAKHASTMLKLTKQQENDVLKQSLIPVTKLPPRRRWQKGQNTRGPQRCQENKHKRRNQQHHTGIHHRACDHRWFSTSTH